MFQQSFKQKVSPSFSIKLSALLGLAHLSNASPMSNNLWTRRFYHTKGLVRYLASGIAPLSSLLITRWMDMLLKDKVNVKTNLIKHIQCELYIVILGTIGYAHK